MFVTSNEFFKICSTWLSKSGAKCHELLILRSFHEDVLNVVSKNISKKLWNLIFRSSIIVSASSKMKYFNLSNFSCFLSQIKSFNLPGVLIKYWLNFIPNNNLWLHSVDRRDIHWSWLTSSVEAFNFYISHEFS